MKHILTLVALVTTSLAQAAPLHINVPDLIDASGLAVVSAASEAPFGFDARTGSGDGVADSFSVGPGGWRVGSFDFFAFQLNVPTFTYTTATWSVVSGNVNDGVVVASGTAAAGDGGRVGYRVADDAPDDTSRALFRIHADIADFDLTEGEYWLTWSLEAADNANIFVASVLDFGGNGRSRYGNVYGQVYAGTDESAVEFAFNINGPGAEPTAGTVPEPSSAALALLACAGLVATSRRRRGQQAVS